jgi:hypothetical protein
MSWAGSSLILLTGMKRSLSLGFPVLIGNQGCEFCQASTQTRAILVSTGAVGVIALRVTSLLNLAKCP